MRRDWTSDYERSDTYLEQRRARVRREKDLCGFGAFAALCIALLLFAAWRMLR